MTAECAAEANSPAKWDALWAAEGRDSWRGKALASVYERIAELMPRGASVVDLGGGVGLLADVLRDKAQCDTWVIDQSEEALRMAAAAGHIVTNFPISVAVETIWPAGSDAPMPRAVVATEVFEHLEQDDVDAILESSKDKVSFFSVPNDRLGPDEEPQHVRKWTAVEFKRDLEKHFDSVRVECLGPIQPDTRAPAFLLGICGLPKQSCKLAVTMPVRDEAADIARTLASFRGVTDLMVIGVDPRSKDATRKIAAKYADVVFELEDPEGRTQPDPPPAKEDGSDVVHFAWLRNQCIDKCRELGADWIFMTEGHESLDGGQDTLLQLDKVMPRGAKIGWVLRRASGQRWGFPWLTSAHDTRLSYERNTHNCLHQPDDAMAVRLAQVRTLHLRDHEREKSRAVQRKSQNRKSLLDDWMHNGNTNSLFYLAGEWRAYDRERSIERMHEYIATSRNGAGRYQMRLSLAKELAADGNLRDARSTLLACTADDWSRTDHWVWLGDIAYEQDQHEEALQFYRYASTSVGREPPFCPWWLDEAIYSYIPAQRMAQVLVDLGHYDEALTWARKVLELMPSDETATEAREEAARNIETLERAIESN